MKIIFVRHGESEANAQLVIADDKPGLTNVGREQAKQTAAKIRNFGITLVVSSPYQRARQTAEIITTELGIDAALISSMDDLHERRFGELENKPRQHPSEWFYTIDDIDDIEPRAAVLARSLRAHEALRILSQQDTVLVVGHACAGFYLWQVSKGHTTLDEFAAPEQLDNAGYRILQD